MDDFKVRLEQEQKELSEKISKLSIFIAKDSFYDIPKIQQSLLVVQLDAMKTYHQVLIQRLENL